jgi:hypothetical protein
MIKQERPLLTALGPEDGHPGTLPRFAVHPDFSAMEGCAVFHDGQTEPCAGDGAGVALIHAVKPLEYTIDIFFGYTDARI